MKKITRKVNGLIKRIIIFFYKDSFPVLTPDNQDDNPERVALFPYCKGLGIDVGCGSRKTHPHAIGVDITPKNMIGKYGSERRQLSQADITASGDNLYMFADGVLDYVVARHNLEHYTDPIKALKEWKRVLKKNGILGVVVPDDDALNTIELDPTHKHAFTRDSFKTMLDTIGGFKIVKLTVCIPKWSFVCIARRV